ncbi:enoyl-CoA hydratase/isomerase family protein [Gordonia sp. VNK21]|uniref:enoyl-CoA hydratase/isomerase family protein n=1 Tax=Gordonia sp. VNK21 TaxID=3382483 RepID=UPI0038D4AA1B
MTDELITLHPDGVLSIAISTAENGTALDHEAVLAAQERLQAVMRGGDDVGAVLLRGAGKNFCAGGNVAKFAGAPDRRAYLRGLADDLHALLGTLYDTRLPVVVEAKGWAAGAGMSLVLHADLAIGGPSTKMRPAYPGIGLSPDGGMSWMLPRIVGLGRARTIIMTDQTLDAQTALDLGILAQVTDDDADVEAAAREAARQLADGPRGSISAIRSLLFDSATATLRDQLDAEAESISQLGISAEGREGVDAFVAKRAPDFRGVR